MHRLKFGNAVVSFGYVVHVVAHKVQVFSDSGQLADYFYFSFVSHDFIPQIVL
jgi:hypothetical protein